MTQVHAAHCAGEAHWHTLLRARAIETQSFVLAAAQAGAHNEKRQSYGHSVAYGPWGEKLGELDGEAPGWLQVRTCCCALCYAVPSAVYKSTSTGAWHVHDVCDNSDARGGDDQT